MKVEIALNEKNQVAGIKGQTTAKHFRTQITEIKEFLGGLDGDRKQRQS